MFYTPMINKALKLCCEAHGGQVDKGGLPYFLHPIHLAYQMTDEDTIIAALLHDVVEDTEYSIQYLRSEGFSDDACDAISLLTRKHGEPYMDYILNLKGNRIARTVKLADLRHNSDLSRLNHVTEKDIKRLARYSKAIAILENDYEG